jgi:hypothetical protein
MFNIGRGNKRMKKPTLFLFFFLFTLTILSITFVSPISNNAVTVSAQTTPVMAISPADISVKNVGDTFTVNITVSYVSNMCHWGGNVTWDNTIVSLVGEPVEGDFLLQAGDSMFLSSAGRIGGLWTFIDELTQWPTGISASGSGVLATLTFRVLKPTVETPINLVDTLLSQPIEDQSSLSGLKLITHTTQTPALVTLDTGELIAKAGQPQTVNEDTPVVLNASKTRDPSNNASYTWTFDDNGLQTITGITQTYSFDYPGDHLVTLTVASPSGGTSNSTLIIHVLDITPPIARITRLQSAENYPLYAGTFVKFSGSQSYDPENGTIANYRWNYNGLTENHTEIDACFPEGDFSITLTVTDARANLTSTTTLQITVLSASLGPSPTSSSGGTGNQNTNGTGEGLTFPPVVTAIIIFITLLVIGGSAFWLLGLKTNFASKKIEI